MITEKLAQIQKTLKAPKGQFNSFGKYNYRSCEDIVEAVKPLLDGAILTLSDEIVAVGDRIYVKATATLAFDNESVKATAYAREAAEKKGMDASQITGTASSYARKYALNGLFAIDDNKDADTDEHQGKQNKAPRINRPQAQTYIAQLTGMIENEDGMGLRQLNDELKDNEDMLHFVWNYFSTEQKSKAKTLIHSVKDAA